MPARRIRYLLERVTPAGEVRYWPDPLTRREAATAVAYCLADNAAAPRREATAVAARIESGELGEVAELVAYGYTFRLHPAAP